MTTIVLAKDLHTLEKYTSRFPANRYNTFRVADEYAADQLRGHGSLTVVFVNCKPSDLSKKAKNVLQTYSSERLTIRTEQI